MNKKYIVAALFALTLSCILDSCKDSKTPGSSSTEQTSNDEEGEEQAIEPTSPAEQQAFEDQKKVIEDFYANYVFGGKPFKEDILHKYCTDRLVQKLKADYDYKDGGGYAIWDFRTDHQDGNGESKINDIIEVAPNCLKVSFTDMGHDSSHRITFANEGNGTWLMDKID